jgi:hypothetical protein
MLFVAYSDDDLKNSPKKFWPMQSKSTFNPWKYQVHTSTHEIVDYAAK